MNTFVRGTSEDMDSVEALSGFKRFPQWMWRNADALDFIGWLREHNDGHQRDTHMMDSLPVAFGMTVASRQRTRLFLKLCALFLLP